MADTPHFDHPFRLTPAGHAVTVEQDSIEEIESCLVAILLTERGERIELSDFGSDSLLFKLQPLKVEDLYSTLSEQEPRALPVISQAVDPVRYLSALVEIDVTAANPTIGDS